MAVLLFAVAYTLGLQDGIIFAPVPGRLIGMVAFALAPASGATWFGFISQRHRQVIPSAAFAVAFLFPFTQNGSDANMSIATQILIFAATAMGLNIVVGLAGLLDLGTSPSSAPAPTCGAMLSNSAFATVGWQPPFVVVMLIGAAACRPPSA